MAPWARSATDGGVFRRPLGGTELGFYWDGVFAGTGDTLQHVQVDVKNWKYRDLFDVANVTRTWLHLKRLFPLLGCTVEERDNGQQADFVADARRLGQVGSDEVSVKSVGSLQHAEDFIELLVNGPRLLSSNLLARVWILPRSDQWSRFHVLIQVAHLITDGLANALILRAFFDALCSQIAEVEVFPGLEQRLMLVVPLEDLHPTLQLSLPRRRWRRAIAAVLHKMQQSKMKGGHTLPRVLSHRWHVTPAHSRLTTVSLPTDVSSNILANCRKARVTFGHAFPVISQLAHARVLHRLRQRRNMDRHEWEMRRRQPMNYVGPLNMRPYLSADWMSEDGAAGVGVLVSSYPNVLPFMPSCELGDDCWDDGAPPFAELLSRERFLLRTRMIKKQSLDFMQHPLFMEFTTLWNEDRTNGVKKVADQWRNVEEIKGNDVLWDASCYVLANSGSSMGNIDGIFPPFYPRTLSACDNQAGVKIVSPSEPVLRATLSTNRLRCRPAELYLGATMSSQRMNIFSFWDGNVYDEATVQEWLAEVMHATEWYLGRATGDKKFAQMATARL